MSAEMLHGTTPTDAVPGTELEWLRRGTGHPVLVLHGAQPMEPRGGVPCDARPAASARLSD